MNQIRADIAKGATGMVASAGGIVTSSLPAIEAWLRVTSLCVGIAVGMLTGYSIWKRLNKDK